MATSELKRLLSVTAMLAHVAVLLFGVIVNVVWMLITTAAIGCILGLGESLRPRLWTMTLIFWDWMMMMVRLSVSTACLPVKCISPGDAAEYFGVYNYWLDFTLVFI